MNLLPEMGDEHFALSVGQLDLASKKQVVRKTLPFEAAYDQTV